jgi:hypothetical protein
MNSVLPSSTSGQWPCPADGRETSGALDSTVHHSSPTRSTSPEGEITRNKPVTEQPRLADVRRGPAHRKHTAEWNFEMAPPLLARSEPIFTDTSGRRRRTMRRLGLVSAGTLTACLGAVVVAMAGGPQAPFTQWAAPHPLAAATPNHGHTDRESSPTSPTSPTSPAGPIVPSSASQPSPQPGHTSSPSSSARSTPRPAPSATPSATSSSASPAPTNAAGRTPPGRTKSPNPRK